MNHLSQQATARMTVSLLMLLLLSTPMRVLAHGGHGNEFQENVTRLNRRMPFRSMWRR